MKSKDNLRDLIIENPNLEVIPFISEDASCCDYLYTVGSIGHSRIDEYVQDPYNEEHFLMKSQDFDDFSDNYCNHYEHPNVPDKTIEEAYDKLDWEKAIFVWIEAY